MENKQFQTIKMSNKMKKLCSVIIIMFQKIKNKIKNLEKLNFKDNNLIFLKKIMQSTIKIKNNYKNQLKIMMIYNKINNNLILNC